MGSERIVRSLRVGHKAAYVVRVSMLSILLWVSSKAVIKGLKLARCDISHGSPVVSFHRSSLDDASPTNIFEIDDLLFNFSFWYMLAFGLCTFGRALSADTPSLAFALLCTTGVFVFVTK